VIVVNQVAIQKLIEIRRDIDGVCYSTSVYDRRRKELDAINSAITEVIDGLRAKH
jgi:hypothetical protein